MSSVVSQFSLEDLFPVHSQTGALLRSVPWSETPLGPVEQWPQSLKTSVSICLNSAFPILIWWGPELVMLYNDAYAPLISGKHPAALGTRGHEVFPEVWNTIGPMLQRAMQRGPAVKANDLLLFLERNGYSEECYFTFSYSPILDESGGIGGVFTPVHETTERVINERRLNTLTTVSEVRTEQARDIESACHKLIEALEKNRVDLPFASLYVFNHDQTLARQVAAYTNCNREFAPEYIEQGAAWPPIGELAQGRTAVFDLGSFDPQQLPIGFWGKQAHQAVLVPLKQPGSEAIKGFLFAALNPRKRLDESYASFLALLAEHLSGAISDAEAIEAERRRAEALAEIDRAKTTFFSNVSHEFRTPLTLMTVPLQETLADPELSDAARERLELARRNTLRLQKLVNNLLDFARIEAGRVHAVFQPVDLVEMTRELVGNFQSAFDKAGLTLTFAAPPVLPLVYVDVDHWEKIVLNLVSNAFKYTLTGGVTVELAPQDHSVTLTVADTGTGIPPSQVGKIFQRFHRVEGAMGRSFEGSGIGLALVQELVQLHKGSISVESDEGVGSRFAVSLPLGSSHLPSSAVAPGRSASPDASRVDAFVSEAMTWLPDSDAASPALAALVTEEQLLIPRFDLAQLPDRKRVLVADDNADMRRYLHRLLGTSFDVETVANGAEALAAVQRQRPDLVLSDVMMPVMDGVQLIRQLRGNPDSASIPAILLSARAGEEAEIQGLEMGADDYLVKPFSARELVARVTAALRIAEIRASSEAALRQSEQELRHTIDLNFHVPWTADSQGNVISFSNRWLDITGLRREDAFGQGWRNVQHPDDLIKLAAAWSNAVQTGSPFDVEHRVRIADGTYRWMRSRALPRRDESGNIVKWYGTEEDIDERKHAEQRLQESERRMRVAQEAAGVVVWEWCTESGEILWGPGVERLYGRGPQDLTFSNWSNALHPDDRDSTTALLDRIVREHLPYEAEYRVVWPDGSMRYLFAKGEIYRSNANGCTYLIGANLDITARKQAEETLRQRDAQIREVLERTTDAVFLLDSHGTSNT